MHRIIELGELGEGEKTEIGKSGMESRSIHFHGPFSFIVDENYLFESEFADNAGIYLWIIKDTIKNLNYIHYVGETKFFAKRQREHITQILGLNYSIIDPNQARKGIHEIIWNGMWRDKSKKAVAETLQNYEFVSKKVIDYIRVIDIYFSPTDFPNDIRKHIEGCIGLNLRNNHPEFKMFYPDDNHVGTKKERLNERLNITADQDISGLNTEIII